MIENKETGKTNEQENLEKNLGTDETTEIIELSDLEPDVDEYVDEIVDISELEKDEGEAKAEEDSEEDVLDLAELSTTSFIEGGTVLELTEEFRAEAPEEPVEKSYASQDEAASLDLSETSDYDFPVEDDSFFDLADASESESGLDFTEEFDLEDDEDDSEVDLADMVETADSEASLAEGEADYPLDEILEKYESIKETKERKTSLDEPIEDELLEKLDDYFSEEEAGEDDLEAAEKKQTPEMMTEIPKEGAGQIELTPAQIEGALDRVIERKYGEKIDEMLNEVVARRVSEEIVEALKSVLLDSIKNRK